MISLLSAATRIACRQMTPEHLNALHASVERASCLSARHDWERKATAHAELFTMLGDVTGDRDLAALRLSVVSTIGYAAFSAARRCWVSSAITSVSARPDHRRRHLGAGRRCRTCRQADVRSPHYHRPPAADGVATRRGASEHAS